MTRTFNKMVDRPLPESVRIGTPPGLGDTYWCMAKMEAFRERHGIKHVTICPKRANEKRALWWPKMVNFVDAAEEFDFNTNKGIRETGFSSRKPGVNVVMWPNAVIDKGHHLRDWMPQYELNLDFEIATHRHRNEPDGDFHLIFASWEGVNNQWFPGRGTGFWTRLVRVIGEKTGKPPVLIGAGWDVEYAKHIDAPFINLVGDTTTMEVAGLIKRAKSLTGIISGMTILGNHFRTPTVAIYPDRFMPGFLTSWIKPETPYTPLKASEVGEPSAVIRELFKLV